MYTPVNATDYYTLKPHRVAEMLQFDVVVFAERMKEQSDVIISYEFNDGLPHTIVIEYERIKTNDNFF